MPATVLIVDDEKNILLTLSQSLQLAGYHTELASSGQVALDVVSARPVDAVLMDVKMPDMDGLTALARLHEMKPELPVIMMSGHGTIDTAVKATQLGARDFLEKPIARDRLLVALRNVLKHQAVIEELQELRAQLGRYDMVGSGPAMQRIFSLIQRTAPSEGRVLITGENGTGKELIARALHQHSRRKGGPFVKLNCAAVPHDLIESELFGHEKGAFTGAVSVRRGKFELAHEGTLFLDEIGDMPLGDAGQAAARAAGGRAGARGRHGDDQGGRARHRRDEQEPGEGDRRRALPRGSLLPHQRGADSLASAARAARGPAGSDRHVPAGGVRAERAQAAEAVAGGARR